MRSILIAALLAAGSAMADEMIAKEGSAYVRLSQQSCSLKLPHQDKLKEGSAYLGGVHYSLCWIVTGEGLVHLFYDDGDRGILPITAFSLERGV